MRAYWGVTDDGNFEGHTILSVVGDRRALAARFKISEAAARRRSSNGRRERLYDGTGAPRLAGARRQDSRVVERPDGARHRRSGARVRERARTNAAAVESAEFLFGALVRDGRVFRSYKNGEARARGISRGLCVARACRRCRSTSSRSTHVGSIGRARWRDAMTEWFWDDATGAFYDTASDHEPLITRPREIADNAMPSGTSLAVELLLRLAEVLDDADARRRATYVVETLAPSIARYPAAFGHLLGSADMLINGAVEVAIVGQPESPDFVALERAAAEHYVPSLVLAGGRATTGIALLAGSRQRRWQGDGVRLPQLRL